jgi:hypothetical protein
VLQGHGVGVAARGLALNELGDPQVSGGVEAEGVDAAQERRGPAAQGAAHGVNPHGVGVDEEGQERSLRVVAPRPEARGDMLSHLGLVHAPLLGVKPRPRREDLGLMGPGPGRQRAHRLLQGVQPSGVSAYSTWGGTVG